MKARRFPPLPAAGALRADGQLLLLRGGGIGDTLVLGPALAALRRAQPGLDVIGIGRRDALEILAAAGLLERAWGFEEGGWWRLFNPALELPAEMRALLARARYWISFGFGRPRADLPLEALEVQVDLAPFPQPGGRAVWRYLFEALVEIFPAMRPPPPDWLPGAQRVSSAPLEQGPLLVQPGSGSAAKNWPLEEYLALARALAGRGWPLIFALGEVEGAGAQRAIAAAGFDFIREPLAAVARRLGAARGFLGNDSGIAHLAAALGLPSVVLFGASDPLAWAPRGPRVLALGERGRWPGAAEVLRAVLEFIPGPPAAGPLRRRR